MRKMTIIGLITAFVLLAAVIAIAYQFYQEGVSDHVIVTPTPTPTPSPTSTPEVTPPVNMTLNNYPKLFEKDVIIVISENVSKTIEYNGWTLHRYPHLSWMNESAEVIAKNLYNLTGNIPAIKNDAELTERDKTESNLILLGIPDVNIVIKEVCKANPNIKRVTSDYPGQWKGVLDLVKNPWNPEKYILIVSGSDRYGTKTVIAKLEHPYKLNNETSVIVEWKSERKEIHQDFDATPALAGLFEPAPLQPCVSNITLGDIGFEVTITDDVSLMLYTGKPMVPCIVKWFEIPGDSEVDSVTVNLSDPIEIRNIFIEPTPKLLYPTEYVIDNETYSSSEPYPGKEYDYKLSGDPIRGKEVVVHVFPIQYIPAESRIIAYKNASISIYYRVPTQEEG